MNITLKKGLAVLTLSLGLAWAWAAAAATQTVEVLNAAGQVVATGDPHGHLQVSGDLGSAATLRVNTTANGVTTVQTFTLAAPITAPEPEAEALKVQVGSQAVSLEAALEHAGAVKNGADDPAGHDAGDDHGASGGHGADDGAGHDAGDDHGGGKDNGGSGGGSGSGSDDGGHHGGGDDHGGGSRHK